MKIIIFVVVWKFLQDRKRNESC